MNWKKEKLASIASYKTGKLDSNAAIEGGKYPFFTCSQQPSKINIAAFDTEAVILGGNNANGIFPLHFYRGEFNAYQRTYVIESLSKEALDNYFLYYSLRLALQYFRNVSIGATTQYLTKSILDNFDVSLPPINVQQKIASILSAYDDLIENNRRRIQLLEESARQLYKEWFVRLRFPGHEHVKVVDGVPEGWERKTIKDVSGFVSRGITPSYDEAAKCLVLNQKCIRNHFVDFEFARRQKKEVSQNKVLQYGDVLINSTGTGTLGRVAQYFGDIKNCTIDSHVTIARPSDASFITYYGYAILDNEDYLSRMGRGSTNQTELSKSVIEDIPFLKPTFTLIERFELAVIETKKQIQTLATQNRKLAQARDLLLPKLMSGEVAV